MTVKNMSNASWLISTTCHSTYFKKFECNFKSKINYPARWETKSLRITWLGRDRKKILSGVGGTGNSNSKKKTTTREWEGMGVILPGVDRTGFSPSFFVGLGREEIHICGSGTGEVWEFTPVSNWLLKLQINSNSMKSSEWFLFSFIVWLTLMRQTAYIKTILICYTSNVFHQQFLKQSLKT